MLKPNVIVETVKITLASGDAGCRAVDELPEGLEIHGLSQKTTRERGRQ